MPEEMPKPELPESLRNGVYANYFSISTSENDAILDFAMMSPEPRLPEQKEVSLRNQVVARVIVSLDGAKKLQKLLGEVLK